MDKYVLIGSRIREARFERKMDQVELAARLGYSPTAVNLYEKGKRKISIEDLEKVAAILRKPLSFFLCEVPYDEDLYLKHEKNRLLREAKDLLSRIEGRGVAESDGEDHGGEAVKTVPVIALDNADIDKALQAADDTMPVPSGTEADFAIRLQSDSMEPVYHQGDILLVQRSDIAENGRRILVRVDDDNMVMIYYRYDNSIVLRPANPKYNDIVRDNVTILGIVTGAYTYS